MVFTAKRPNSVAAPLKSARSRQLTKRIGNLRLEKKFFTPTRGASGTTFLYPCATGLRTQKYSLSLKRNMARWKDSNGSGIVAISSSSPFSPFPGFSLRSALSFPEVTDTSGDFRGFCSKLKTTMTNGGRGETGEEGGGQGHDG